MCFWIKVLGAFIMMINFSCVEWWENAFPCFGDFEKITVIFVTRGHRWVFILWWRSWPDKQWLQNSTVILQMFTLIKCFAGILDREKKEMALSACWSVHSLEVMGSCAPLEKADSLNISLWRKTLITLYSVLQNPTYLSSHWHFDTVWSTHLQNCLICWDKHHFKFNSF